MAPRNLVPGMPEDHDTVAEEMYRIDKGADFGWPYTYYDTALHARVLAPEYGGDGKMPATEGNYSTPVVAFESHQSPVDLQFYDGKQFPQKYRGGAFVAFQGGSGKVLPNGRSGYDVTFVPFDKSGKAGTPEIFANNFAGPRSRPTAIQRQGAIPAQRHCRGPRWLALCGGHAERPSLAHHL